jgi:hypothetical protein
MSDVIEIIDDLPENELVQTPSLDIFSDEDNRQALVDYLVQELDAVTANQGREDKIERNKKIARQRQAIPPTTTKDDPWPNASNVEPPFALQKTNTIVTKLEASYRAKKPLFVYSAEGQWEPHAKALTKYVQQQIESPYGINFYTKLWPILYNGVSYGTQFVKVAYKLDSMRFTRKSAEGGEQKVDKIIKASPEIIPIPFEDFLTRSEWPDLQRAPWVGVRYYKHTHELKRLQQQGFYQNVDLILNETTGLDESKESEMEFLGTATAGSTSSQNDWYAIYECNVFWDTDGDGFDEDIIVHIEKSTGTILRAEYNELGTRDYVRLPYIDIPNNLYGLGVGDIMIGLQDEAAALHNMRNDSMHLSMLPFLITTSGSDLGQSIELYPGKIVRTSNPREDVIVEKFNDIGLSSMSAEGLLKEYADNATGASSVLAGQDAGGQNRIGATGTQFLAGQSNSFLDSIANSMSDRVAEIGMLILYQIIRNKEFLNLEAVNPSDRGLLEQIFALNVEDIPTTMRFTARVASIQDSKQVKQQQAMGLMQVYTMYGDKMTQIIAQLENPQLQQTPRVLEMISTYAVGFTKIMEEALKGFDADNIGDFLPYTRDLMLALQMSDAQKDMQVDQAEAGIASRQTERTANTVQPVTEGSGGGNIVEGQGSGDVPQPVQDTGDGEVVGGTAI